MLNVKIYLQKFVDYLKMCYICSGIPNFINLIPQTILHKRRGIGKAIRVGLIKHTSKMDLMKLSIMDALSEEGMSQLLGGIDLSAVVYAHINNGKNCNEINNGVNCDVINNGVSCSQINSVVNCGIVNNNTNCAGY